MWVEWMEPSNDRGPSFISRPQSAGAAPRGKGRQVSAVTQTANNVTATNVTQWGSSSLIVRWGGLCVWGYVGVCCGGECSVPAWVDVYLLDVLTWRPPLSLLTSFDVLLSDLMSNTTGVSDIDGRQSAALALTALRLSTALLQPNGSALVKLFQSRHSQGVLEQFNRQFSKVTVIKPQASRSESKEVFLLARGKKRERNGVGGETQTKVAAQAKPNKGSGDT